MSQDEESRSITVTRDFDAPPSILFRLILTGENA